MDNVMTLQADTALMQSRSINTKMNAAHQTDRQMRQAAEDFEAVFLGQMMQPMFAGTEAEAPFGGGQAEKMWKSMQIDEYGKALARNGGIGLADAVYAQMLQMQEAAQTTQTMNSRVTNAYTAAK